MYIPKMKTIEQRGDHFAKLIFNMPYKRCYPDRLAFIDYHADQYNQYRKAIMEKVREIRNIKRISTKEYEEIYECYILRISLDDVLAGYETGLRWANQKNIPVGSCVLFHTFVTSRHNQQNKNRLSYIHRLGEQFNLEDYEQRDRWLFRFFRAFHITYDDQFFFDPFWGCQRRYMIYLFAFRGGNYLYSENPEDAHALAEKVGIGYERFWERPFHHYRVQPSKFRSLIQAGARRADEKKVEEILSRGRE